MSKVKRAKEAAGEVPAGTAEAYRKSLEEIYATRGGQEMAAAMEGQTDAELLFGVAAGFDQFANGMMDAVAEKGGEVIPAAGRDAGDRMEGLK